MIGEACNYIKYNLQSELSIEEIACKVFVSRYYFMRQFKEVKGISVHQYILKERLSKARELMKEGFSLTTIAYQVGFKDYTSFARAFKKVYHKSPREFQKLIPSIDLN
jgi:AraC-like DNA-binding protein